MESLTKVELTPGEIEALARAAFGSGVRLIAADRSDEGWFNAGYALTLTGPGPRRAFLKVGPPPDVPVLTYEHRLMRAETRALEALARAEAPHVPAVLATDFSGRIIASDALFMAFVEGTMFSHARARMSEAERVRVRRQIGEVCGLANRIEGEVFGYPGQPSLQAGSWRAAFEEMIGRLLEDARRFGAPLAEPAEALALAFERASPLLEGAWRPCLTHYDLWDNNVLVRQGADGWELCGVLDWERGFFGDPLADVISLTAIGSADEQAAALAGQASARGEAFALDKADRRRLALYRAYLWLIMIVEAGPRGFGGSIRTPSSAAARRLERDLAAASG
jgi:aminoglycoside phosphotransferase (APT) family kinase protein